jgi:hypothetical protein
MENLPNTTSNVTSSNDAATDGALVVSVVAGRCWWSWYHRPQIEDCTGCCTCSINSAQQMDLPACMSCHLSSFSQVEDNLESGFYFNTVGCDLTVGFFLM